MSQEVREFQAGGLVVTYVVEDSRSVPGASDVVFTTTAHAWPLTLLLRGVEASSKSTVTVTASPNLGGVETFEVKEAAHPGGLLAGGMPSCGVQPGLMWSTATSVSTRSGLPEVVVRLPAAVTVGGSVSRIAGVFI